MRLFLSYSRQNEQAAQQLFSELQVRGIYVWFDRETLLPGQDWQAEITKAVSESDTVLLLLSSQSVDRRGYFQKEMRLALDVLQTIPHGHIYLLPIRLDNCRIPDPLTPIHYVDLFPDYKAGLRKIFSALDFQQELQVKVQASQSKPATAGTNLPSVLLVNDQPSTMNALTDHLKSYGLSVNYAFNVPQAIKFIHNNNPDVIISDLSHFSFGVQVTSRAAFEILEWGLKNQKDLKVIVTCADITDERQEEATELRAIGICNDASNLYRFLRESTGHDIPNPFPPDQTSANSDTQRKNDHEDDQLLAMQPHVFLWSMLDEEVDAEFTHRLADDLMSRGLDTYVIRKQRFLFPVGSIAGNMEDAVKYEEMDKSDAVVFLLSGSAAKAPRLEEDVYRALMNREAIVVPVLLDDEGAQNLPLMLRDVKPLDLRSNYEKAVEELVSLIRSHKHQ